MSHKAASEMVHVIALVLLPLAVAQPPVYDAVPMEVRVPLDVGDCIRAVKSIDYEDLQGNSRLVDKGEKGTLVHVASDHVVVKWNRHPSLSRAAAFPHQVRRAQWPKGPIASVNKFFTKNSPSNLATAGIYGVTNYDYHPGFCMTVIERHGFPPMIKPMRCVANWQHQQFTTPLTCRPGQIYWKKDPTLCVEVVHSKLIQLRDCSGAESQMFAMREPDQTPYQNPEFNENGGADPLVTWQGFLAHKGIAETEDKCFAFDCDPTSTAAPFCNPTKFVVTKCDLTDPTLAKFTFTDFSRDME